MVAFGIWSRSVLVGDGYGLMLSVGLSWPFARRLGKGLSVPCGLFWRSLLLFVASLVTSTAAVAFLGFNPQAARLSSVGWAEARALIWRFPLALPVENWILVLFLAAFGAIARDRQGLANRVPFAAATAAALAFGVLHVPYWGGWAWFPVAASVLPWTVYMTMSGDLIAPVIAHVLLDMSVALALWPRLHAFASGATLVAGGILWVALGLLFWLGQKILRPLGEVVRHA